MMACSRNGVMERAAVRFSAALVVLSAGLAPAQVGTSKHLYTDPDPEAGGGIRGSLAPGSDALVAAFAIPPADPLKVYRAEISGARQERFSFSGLPVAKYDLVLAFDRHVVEGLKLERGTGSLTSNDVAGVEAIVARTEPYFNEKIIHRLDGTSGNMTGHARAICTFLRSKTSTGFMDGKPYRDHRRSLKLVLLAHVGPGWQVERTREILVRMVPPGQGYITHSYSPKLGDLRVTDSVRDLGVIPLKSLGEATGKPSAP